MGLFGGFLGKAIKGIGSLFLKKKAKDGTRALTGFGERAIGFGQGMYGQNRAYSKARQKSMLDFELNKQMFDYQNAYNTPKAQMQRLKDAGLNPALMYGQGTTGNAQGYPQINTGDTSFNPAEIAQTTAAGAQVSLTNALRQKTIAEKNNIEEGTILTRNQAEKVISERLKIDADKAKTIQETLNLKTTSDILELSKQLKAIEIERANKGTVKGDTIGNLLDILNLDPKNNEGDKTLLQTAFTAYFGAKIAKDILSGFNFKKSTINNSFRRGQTIRVNK